MICYLEPEKFTGENYKRQMGYLKGLEQSFQETIYLEKNNVAELFCNANVQESICITTSPDLAAQMQGLGISVVGFEADKQELMKAPYIVLGLDEISYKDLVRIFRRWHNLPWDILETKRLLVRELSLEDLDKLRALYDKPHVTDFVEPLYAPEQERQYQQNYIDKIYGFYGFGMWLVLDKETGRLVGRAGFEYRDYCREGEVEMGYLIDPDLWHRGYATEVCQALLTYARDELNVQRVLCRVSPENAASCGLLDKLGFTIREKGEEWIFSYDL
ncbi:MAG: GNAT family N-acetyltransferase [Lachnospiraceae bacterium]|nr:GNAT family N-acetyltransferase [Lachnospiraceae bacterium]